MIEVKIFLFTKNHYVLAVKHHTATIWEIIDFQSNYHDHEFQRLIGITCYIMYFIESFNHLSVAFARGLIFSLFHSQSDDSLTAYLPAIPPMQHNLGHDETVHSRKDRVIDR